MTDRKYNVQWISNIVVWNDCCTLMTYRYLNLLESMVAPVCGISHYGLFTILVIGDYFRCQSAGYIDSWQKSNITRLQTWLWSVSGSLIGGLQESRCSTVSVMVVMIENLLAFRPYAAVNRNILQHPHPNVHPPPQICGEFLHYLLVFACQWIVASRIWVIVLNVAKSWHFQSSFMILSN
jgi:hypothetical protein